MIGLSSAANPPSLAKRTTSRTGTLIVQSTWPDWIAATRAEGSLMISMVTRATFGFGPQYLSLRSSTMREFSSYSASR